jgi:hypothetical protein
MVTEAVDRTRMHPQPLNNGANAHQVLSTPSRGCESWARLAAFVARFRSRRRSAKRWGKNSFAFVHFRSEEYAT